MAIRTLEIIRDEHQALAAMLRSLSMLLAHARRHGAMPDFDVLRAMLFYIDEFPERLHHTKESELLFPRVRARVPALGPVLDRLDNDHALGETAIRELEHALLAFEVMGPSRREALANTATNGLAVRPCSRILSRIVKTTVTARVPPPGRSAASTMIPNTMLARPRGPNQPMNSLASGRSASPCRDR